MQIERRIINKIESPFIVADISANHNQNLDTARQLVIEAKRSGCDAVKFQTYKPESMTLDYELKELYKRAYLPFKWHDFLFKIARGVNIIAFSSVFCEEGLELLESLDCPAYKIASFELRYLPLLEKVRKTGKPVIFSDGIAEFSDLSFINTNFSGINTAVLKCVSQYPAKSEDFNLATIKDMKQQFDFEVGLSDHTLSTGVACTAVGLGATIIEKHFTLKRNGGIDDKFSMEPQEMKSFVSNVRDAHKAMGQVKYGGSDNTYYGRSLYAIKGIKVGEPFTKENIGVLRPNRGLTPLAWYSALGSRSYKEFKKGEPIDKLA